MALSQADWREIQAFVTQIVSQHGETIMQAKVVKRDTKNKLIWVKELGDQPIPLLAFDYRVTYYYNEPYGNTTTVGSAVNARMKKRKTKDYTKEVEVLTPKVGETVLIALHYGARRLPKCIGVIKSKNYVRASGSD